MTTTTSSPLRRIYNWLNRNLRPNTTFTYAQPSDPLPRAAAINFLEHLMGISRLRGMYNRLERVAKTKPLNPWNTFIDEFRFKLRFDERQLAKIPKDGPVIFIGNHVYGLLDGGVLAHLAYRTRGQLKLFINSAFALCRDPYFGKDIYPIIFDETKDAARENIEISKQALAYLREGGTIAIFPSGATATAPNVFDKAREGEWKLFTAKMIQQSKATVVPVFFHGQNSWRFHLANKVNRYIRYAMVVGEAIRRMDTEVHVEIGDPIPYEKIAHIKGRRKLLNHLRKVVYRLGGEEYTPQDNTQTPIN